MLKNTFSYFLLDAATSMSQSSSSKGSYLNQVLKDGHADATNLFNGHFVIGMFAGAYKFLVWACVIGIAAGVFLYQKGSSKNSDSLRMGGSGTVWAFYGVLLWMYFAIAFYASNGQITGNRVLAVVIIAISEYFMFFFAPKQYVNAMHAYALYEMSDRQDLKHTADGRSSVATLSTAFTVVFILLVLMLHSIF